MAIKALCNENQVALPHFAVDDGRTEPGERKQEAKNERTKTDDQKRANIVRPYKEKSLAFFANNETWAVYINNALIW